MNKMEEEWPEWKRQLGEYPPEEEEENSRLRQAMVEELNTWFGASEGNQFLKYFFQKCNQGYLVS